MQTILVVEDDQSITDIVSDILIDVGHRVITASNGREALARLQSEHPNLIISDVMMPVMDGRELCQRLHAHPQHSSIPIVLVSAVYNARELVDCKHVAFIKKPFDVEELIGTVSATLGEGSAL